MLIVDEIEPDDGSVAASHSAKRSVAVPSREQRLLQEIKILHAEIGKLEEDLRNSKTTQQQRNA